MVTIIFESHGTTFDNESHLSSGRYDVELSPLGIEQAGQLGERYKDKHLDVVFCSDLQRSYKTGEIAFAGRNVSIVQDARLSECDYGDWTRKPSEEVEKERGNRVSVSFPGGKSYEQCAQDMKLFLQDVLRDYDGKTIMIIGHRATQYGLEHWIKGVPLKKVVTDPWKWQPGWIYELEKI